MTIETQMRAALADRAQDVPTSSISRLTGRDYHPRTRRLRPPVAIGAGAGAVGTAGAVAAIVSLSAGASSAFAGWSAKPSMPTPAQLASAKLSCAGRSPIAGLPLVLSDTRGPFTFEVYANDQDSAICTAGPAFSSVSGSTQSDQVTVPADQIEASIAHTANGDGQAYSFADGRTGAGVSAVTLVLDDGSDVTATAQNGWFVAWWPGGQELKAALLATPSGTQTQTIRDHSPCGTNTCSGGSHGTRDGAVSGSSFGSGTGGRGAQHGGSFSMTMSK